MLSEPEWYAMITNFAVLGPVGRELIHSYSRPYPGYSVEETNKKIRHALAYASSWAAKACMTPGAFGHGCKIASED